MQGVSGTLTNYAIVKVCFRYVIYEAGNSFDCKERAADFPALSGDRRKPLIVCSAHRAVRTAASRMRCRTRICRLSPRTHLRCRTDRQGPLDASCARSRTASFPPPRLSSVATSSTRPSWSVCTARYANCRQRSDDVPQRRTMRLCPDAAERETGCGARCIDTTCEQRGRAHWYERDRRSMGGRARLHARHAREAYRADQAAHRPARTCRAGAPGYSSAAASPARAHVRATLNASLPCPQLRAYRSHACSEVR